jgi:hypothetical protein
MLCEYGCGNISNFTFKNGKNCCQPKFSQCPEVRKIRSEKRLNNPKRFHSEESKKKCAKGRKGKPSWNKGLTMDNHPSLAIISEKLKGKTFTEEHRKNLSIAFTGREPWNKGLTAETDSRIQAGDRNGMFGKTHTEEVKQATRERNELYKNSWRGENNPWFGKDRSGYKSPRWIPEETKRLFKDYYNKVYWLSEKIYEENISLINPDNLPRTLAGIEGGYQLDHVVSVHIGFLYNISPDLISSLENLRLISWKENRQKGDKITNESSLLLEQWNIDLSKLVPLY